MTLPTDPVCWNTAIAGELRKKRGVAEQVSRRFFNDPKRHRWPTSRLSENSMHTFGKIVRKHAMLRSANAGRLLRRLSFEEFEARLCFSEVSFAAHGVIVSEALIVCGPQFSRLCRKVWTGQYGSGTTCPRKPYAACSCR